MRKRKLISMLLVIAMILSVFSQGGEQTRGYCIEHGVIAESGKQYLPESKDENQIFRGMSEAMRENIQSVLLKEGEEVDRITLDTYGNTDALRDQPREDAMALTMTESGSYTHTTKDGVHCVVSPTKSEWFEGDRAGSRGGSLQARRSRRSDPFDRTTSQQTTLLSKTGFRPVFSCAPLLLLFPKKLTLFGDLDKKRRMSVCFIRKQEGFEPVRAWENTWVDKTEGLCQPL